MNKQTAWLNRQRWHKLMLVSLLVLCSPVATMVTEGRVLAFYPKLQDKRSRLDLTISSSAVAGMGTPNSPVKFTTKLVNNGNQTVNGLLGWSINSTAISPAKIASQAIQIDAGETKELTKTIVLPQTGFVEMVCKFEQGETVKSIQKTSRVGCNPNQLLTPLTQQKDFDEFWERSIAELNAVPPAFKMIEQPKMSDGNIRVFEISMRSHDQVRVRGWLEVPRQVSKPLPVVIRVPGYGQNMKPIGKCDDMIVFSFNPRGHGNSQQDISGQPNNFWIRGLDNAETYYYRGSYLDCIRAVDFISSRPDVDQD